MPASPRKQITSEVAYWERELPIREGDTKSVCARLRIGILIVLAALITLSFFHPLYGIPGAITLTWFWVAIETGCLNCYGNTRLLHRALHQAKTLVANNSATNEQLVEAGNRIETAVRGLTCVIRIVKIPPGVKGDQHGAPKGL